MLYFAIGAGVGLLQMSIRVIRRPTTLQYPIQGFLMAGALGAVIYGTILWLMFG